MAYPETLPDGASAGENGHVTDHNLLATAVGNIDNRLRTVELAAPSGMTQEQIQDMLSTFLVAGSGLTLNYNDTSNTLTLAATGGGGGSMTREEIEDILASSFVGAGLVGISYDDTLNRFVITGTAAYQGSVYFGADGDLTTRTGKLRIYNDSGRTRIISSVRASVATAPAGSTIIADLNKGGTTIFGTQSARPTLAISGFTNKTTAHTVTTWEDGTYLTCDIDQVGSSVAGSDLTVCVEWVS